MLPQLKKILFDAQERRFNHHDWPLIANTFKVYEKSAHRRSQPSGTFKTKE